MITRKPKLEVLAKQKALYIVEANHFDYEDGGQERRTEVITRNLLLTSTSATVKHTGTGKPKPAATAKPKAKVVSKPKPKQTKKPSQKKQEATEKKKPKPKNKVKPGQKSPAAKKPKVGGEKQSDSKRRAAGGGGSGGRSPARKAKVPKEHITVRWAKMSPSAKSSYIQSRAGKSIKTADADEALTKIWSKLSLAQQKAHQRRHPNTRLKVKGEDVPQGPDNKKGKSGSESKKKKTSAGEDVDDQEIDEGDEEDNIADGSPGPKDDKPAEWWADQTPEFQQDYINNYPDSKFSKRHRGIVRNLAATAGDKIKSESRKIGSDYHQGMDGLRAWRDGAKMTEPQKEGLKKTAVKAGSLLVLALVTVALFTPLGPAAMEFGEAWWNEAEKHSSTSAEYEDDEALSGVNLEGHENQDPNTKKAKTADDKQLAWMTNSMTEFLLKQKDIPAFVKKISKST